MGTINKFLSIFFLCFSFSLPAVAEVLSIIDVSRTPDEGIQPMMVTDDEGIIHLVYFKELSPETGNGHIYYRFYTNDSKQWSEAVQISSTPFQQQGSIARASMAIDASGRAHVTWLKSHPYEFMYSRSNPQRSKYEPERSMIKQHIADVEAAASIATYKNSVSLTWHAGDQMTEDSRTVYMITSTNGGETFQEEKQIGNDKLGACGCCGLAAKYKPDGKFMVAYRTAINRKGRHMQLLTTDSSDAYTSNTQLLSEWNLEACPVSTNDFSHNDNSGENWLVYENEGKIYQHNTDKAQVTPTLVRAPTSATRQKHPAIAINQAGNRLIAWGEGAGFVQGGILQMQLFDKENNLLSTDETVAIEIPNFSMPAVAPKQDGSFLLLY